MKRVHFALNIPSRPEDEHGSSYDRARSHRKTSGLRRKECLDVKLSRIKADIDNEFTSVKESFESVKPSSEHSLQKMSKKLKDIETELELGAPFENLLKELYLKPNLNREEINRHEE